MKKFNQRWLSATMALAMAASMTAPALAAGDEAEATLDDSTGLYTSSTTITGKTNAPTIKITVPQTGAVIVNPYNMAYDLSQDGGSGTSEDQIISATQYIKNESDVRVSVTAYVAGTPAGEAVLTDTEPAPEDTNKSVYMYFEMKENADGSSEPSWAGSYDEGTMLLVKKDATFKEDMITMDEKDGTNAYAAFHLAGAASTKPTKPWTANDKVDVLVYFSFKPLADEV